MKEYEYITYGIECVLVDELVGVICQESLESKPYPDGFRRIFDNFILLRERFRKKSCELGQLDLPESELGIITEEFVNMRNRFLEAFLVEIESNYPKLDIRQRAKDYLEAIESDDVVTTEKRVCVYPYLISQAILSDEEEYENGTHD